MDCFFNFVLLNNFLLELGFIKIAKTKNKKSHMYVHSDNLGLSSSDNNLSAEIKILHDKKADDYILKLFIDNTEINTEIIIDDLLSDEIEPNLPENIIEKLNQINGFNIVRNILSQYFYETVEDSFECDYLNFTIVIGYSHLFIYDNKNSQLIKILLSDIDNIRILMEDLNNLKKLSSNVY